ncbi:MAG: class II aldolase/adducin family protein [Christensenellaceae bacterium]|jgi:L-fuculose-phosphate aldolase|nr:class II aldolase/adducin family protein [Christensenellaceae bacterium]
MNYVELIKAQELKEYSEKLSVEGLIKAGDLLSVRVPQDEMLLLRLPDGDITNADFTQIKFNESSDFTNSDIHGLIYENRSDINAIVTGSAPMCVAIASTERKFPAVLDDVAQIIGPRIYIAKKRNTRSILKCLKKRGACLIRCGIVVATGRTLDEAHTCALVLEKGARCLIEATVLGGAYKIPYLEAALMRFVYKTKYSKADQTAKMQK